MAALIDIVKKGAANRSVTLRIIDSTDGTPETGVVFNTSGIDLWYRRESSAKVSITEATLAALTTAHTDGGFLHISDGEYRLDLPDAAFATGANHVDVGGTVTGMVVIGGRVRLVDYDPEDTVRLGLTALPNAAAAAAGGLPVSDAGALDLDSKLAATNEVTAARMGALTDWINGGRLDLILDARASQASVDTIDGIVDDILADTAVIGAAGAGLTALATQASVDALNDPTAAAIADAVLDEATAGHTTAGTLGKAIIDILADTNELQGDDVPGLIAALNDIAVADILTTAMTESYNADGSAPTLAQALHLIIAVLTEMSYSGTTGTAKKLDGSTTAATFTLDDGTSPTSITRAS
jgi:hypothetical protein